MKPEGTMRQRLTRTGSNTRNRTSTRTRTRTVSSTTVVGDVRAVRRARLKRLVRRTWRATRRRFSVATRAITPLGWFVLAVAGLGIAAGVAGGWVEAWCVAVCAALLLLVALPFLFGSRAYNTHLSVATPNIVAGDEVRLVVRVENPTSRPQLSASLELPVGDALRELAVPLLGPQQAVDLEVTVPAVRRGIIAAGPITVARQDPLGLLRREVTWREIHRIHVHPNTVLLPPNSAGLVRDLEGQTSKKLTDSDLSFHAVREYVPGDAMRHVHWKSTAKTGTLMVRQYEQSESARIAVLFDAKREEYASDEEFELGVSVAASLSVQAVREGRERFVASAWVPGRLRPRLDGLEELRSRDQSQLLNAWSELGHAPEGLPIETLARSLAHTVRDLSVVVIVTGAAPSLDRLRRAAIAFSPDVQVVVVRAAAFAEPAAKRIDQATIATVGVLSDLPRLMMRGAR